MSKFKHICISFTRFATRKLTMADISPIPERIVEQSPSLNFGTPYIDEPSSFNSDPICIELNESAPDTSESKTTSNSEIFFNFLIFFLN